MIPRELQSAKPLTGKERLGANRDSEYLGAEDIEPGTEPILTIKALYNAKITLARGKEQHDVIVFAEERVPGSINTVRPLVVNATNRKTLRKLYKGTSADTLVGKKIQLFIEHDVRDPSTGDKVDGIRIRNRVPTIRTEPIKCEGCGKAIEPFGRYGAEEIAQIAKNRFGKCLCVECSKKMSEAQEAEQKEKEQAEEATENVVEETKGV
jgi:hypothetical protein